MLRASSRQRLASSDVFDAAIPGDSSSSSSSSSASRHSITDKNKNKKPELSSEIGAATHVKSHHQEEEDVMPADHHQNDDDFYSVAGYTVDSNIDVHAGRRSSSVANAVGWSFDHSEDDRELITSALTNSLSSAARRKRERSERSSTNSTAVSGSSMKKNVSFSALPRFPSLIEENPIPLDEMDAVATRIDAAANQAGQAEQDHQQQGMARTPSLLDLLAVKPSGSAVGAMNLPVSNNPAGERLVPLSSAVASTSNGQQAKTLVIPRVPSKIGLGNRVASDLSLSSTLSRYMSVPSNLCDIAAPSGGEVVGGAGAAITLEGNVADISMTMSTSSSIEGNYSPSSQSQGAVNLSMDSNDAVDDADANTIVTAKVLPGDALCNVASYLFTSELRDLSTTNADLRVHFAGPSGKHLWVDHATRRWPSILQPEEEDGGIVAGGRQVADAITGRANRFDDKVVEIVDRIGVATAGLGAAADIATLSKFPAQNEVSNQLQQQPNLSALLGLAAKDCPTSMSPCPMPSASEVPGRQRRIRSGEEFAVVRVLENCVNVSSAVQFTARVGEGDRSITSDSPLPRPLPPPRKNIGGESSGTASSDSGGDVDNTIKSNSSSNRWSPRLPPISVPSPTQTLITFLRSASRVSSRGDDDEDDTTIANGRLGKLRPFVCPYVASEDTDRTVIDMTPRLVAYYEVKILPRDAIVERSNSQEDAQTAATIREGFAPPATGVTIARGHSHHHHHRRGVLPEGPEMPPLLRLPGPALGGAPVPAVPLPRNLPQPRHVLGGQQHGIGAPGDDNNDGNNDESLDAECVAIGLSTSRFRPAAKMPGWDAHSFGYHSDDGGIFHGAGDMERQYGSTYGVGDTVGCGIDYSHGEGGGSIFFTLNGKFLGYAWTNVAAISLGEDMYPTVGVDTNCPLEINFGSRPFAFDLGSFVEDQRKWIEQALGPLVSSASINKEEECGRDDDLGRYLDHGLGETHLFSSSKIDEWGSLEPMTSPQGDNAAAPMVFGGEKLKRGSDPRFSSGGGSVLRSTRARNGGFRRPRMFRGHA